MTFTFMGKKYEQKNGDDLVEAGTQELDPGKTLKYMDVNVTDGENKGKKQLAFYEINGDTCKICFAQHESKDKPTKFETKDTDNHNCPAISRTGVSGYVDRDFDLW